MVSSPHGEPSFRPSTHISDLTAELLRLDIRADAGIDDRGWTERTGERDRAIRAVRAGVQRRTASMTLAKEVMEPTAAEWPALSPTSRTVPLKTGYASVAKKGVTTAATAKVESPMVETTLEKPPSRPTSPTTKTAAKPPTPPPPATAQHPPKPPTDEPSDLPVFSHKIPIKGHFTRPPNVAYTTDPAEVEDLIGCLRGPLSLDLEWPPPGQGKAIPRKLRGGKIVHIRRPVYDAKLGKNVWPEAPVSVVQIADARLVIVFQMLHDPEIHVRARTQGRNLTMPHSMPPALLRLLADPERVKCGVNIKQDGNKLWRDFGVPTAGLLELSAVARHVDSARWPDKGLISLARLAAAYLGADLDKGDVRTGDWSARLDAEQVSYAANDAFAGRLIYDALLKRGRETDTTLYIGNMCASVGCEQTAGRRNAQGPTNLKPTAEPYKPLGKSSASPGTSPKLSPRATPFQPQVGVQARPGTNAGPRAPRGQQQPQQPVQPPPFQPPPGHHSQPSQYYSPHQSHQSHQSHQPHQPHPTHQPQPRPQPRPHSFPHLPIPPPHPPPQASQGKPLTAFSLFESGFSVADISARFRLHVRATQTLVLDGAARARSLSPRLQARLRGEIAEGDAIWRNYSVLRCIVWDAAEAAEAAEATEAVDADADGHEVAVPVADGAAGGAAGEAAGGAAGESNGVNGTEGAPGSG